MVGVGVQQDEQRESEKRGFIVCLGFFLREVVQLCSSMLSFFFVICWINIKTDKMQSNTHKPARNTFLSEPEAGKDRNLSRAIKDNY